MRANNQCCLFYGFIIFVKNTLLYLKKMAYRHDKKNWLFLKEVPRTIPHF